MSHLLRLLIGLSILLLPWLQINAFLVFLPRIPLSGSKYIPTRRLFQKNQHIQQNNDNRDQFTTPPSLFVSQLNWHSSSINYLTNILQFDHISLIKLLKIYPNIVQMNADTEIKPIITILEAYDFTLPSIRKILLRAPQVVFAKHGQTLQQKLINLCKLFQLSSSKLTQIIQKTPTLLDCSIDHLIKIMNTLKESLGFTNQQITQIVMKKPSIFLQNKQFLINNLQLLYSIYGFTKEEVKRLILQHPYLLTYNLSNELNLRMNFLINDLQLPELPSKKTQTFLKKYPMMLIVSPSKRLIMNKDILFAYFQCPEEKKIRKLFFSYPPLLFYNPKTLEMNLNSILFTLTGVKEFYSGSSSSLITDINDEIDEIEYLEDEEEFTEDEEVDEETKIELFEEIIQEYQNDNEVVTSKQQITRELFLNNEVEEDQEDLEEELEEDEESLLDLEALSSSSSSSNQILEDELSYNELDLIRDLLVDEIEYELESKLVPELSFFRQESYPLNIPMHKALQVIYSWPSLIAYSQPRTKRILYTLGQSLALTKEEISKMISTYPRILSFSVEGKLSHVIRTIALKLCQLIENGPSTTKSPTSFNRATRTSPSLGLKKSFLFEEANDEYLLQKLQSFPYPPSTPSTPSSPSIETKIWEHRQSNIRKEIRKLLVRYPLLIGSSLEKIRDRLDLIQRFQLPIQYLPYLVRRKPEEFQLWLHQELNNQISQYMRSQPVESTPKPSRTTKLSAKTSTKTTSKTSKASIIPDRQTPLIKEVEVLQSSDLLPNSQPQHILNNEEEEEEELDNDIILQITKSVTTTTSVSIKSIRRKEIISKQDIDHIQRMKRLKFKLLSSLESLSHTIFASSDNEDEVEDEEEAEDDEEEDSMILNQLISELSSESETSSHSSSDAIHINELKILNHIRDSLSHLQSIREKVDQLSLHESSSMIIPSEQLSSSFSSKKLQLPSPKLLSSESSSPLLTSPNSFSQPTSVPLPKKQLTSTKQKPIK